MKKIYILMIAVLLGGIAKGQWQQTTQFGHPLGFEEFISHDSTIYGSNGTQIYKTTNNGQVWNKINLPVSTYEDYIDSYSVIDSSIIINGIGGHQGVTLVLRASFDNGNTWINYIDSFPYNFSPGKIRNFNDTLYLGTKYGIYFSINKGLNWNVFKNIDTCVSDLFIKGNNIYAIIYNDNSEYGIKKSNDNGNTWIDISNGLPHNKYFQSTCVLGNKLYLKVNNDSIYVSDNDGQNWKPMQYGLTTNYSNYNNPLTVYNDTVYYQDENSTYKASASDTIWNEIQLPYKGKYFLNGNLKFLGTRKGNLISNNYGNSWSPINNGLDITTRITSLASKGNDIYATTDIDGIFKTSNNGQSWIPLQNVLLNNDYFGCLRFKDTVIYSVVNGNSIKKSYDNGITWLTVYNTINNNYINEFKIKGNKLIIATTSGLHMSDSLGLNWNLIQNGVPDSTFYDLEVDGNKIYAITENCLYFSINGGINWNILNSNCGGRNLSVEANQILVGKNNNFDFNYSEDYGLSWSTIHQPFHVTEILLHSNLMFFAGEQMLPPYTPLFAYSNNKGQTLIYENVTFLCDPLLIINDTLYVAGSTIWRRPLSDFVGINEKTQNTQLHLYPNPATNTLTLSLNQQQGLQKATVIIYDIQGKQLLQQDIAETQKQIDISSFAKGIYIVKLQTDKECLQSKFVKE